MRRYPEKVKEIPYGAYNSNAHHAAPAATPAVAAPVAIPIILDDSEE